MNNHFMYRDNKGQKSPEALRSFLERVENMDGLVIEEDTIYELDEECIRCQQKDKNYK